MIVALLIWLLSLLDTSHDIHLSVTEITRDENKLEVVSKIFLDDLQNAMGLVPGEELPEDYTGSDDLIQKFIDENLLLSINEQSIQLELTATQSALPAIWATFETEDINWGNQTELSVVNRIMVDLFDDQKNIIKIDFNGQREEGVLDTKTIKKIFKF